ncbi:hypothetical protein V6626_22330, partial [Bacillus thuringiensis]
MTQTMTVKVKLLPTKEQIRLLEQSSHEYIKLIHTLVSDDDKVRFFGNGRKNKYMKRKFRSVRRKLGEAKKLNALRQLDDKEQ